jgi:hypothetical protein
VSNTGDGDTTVFSGPGNTQITLNDSTGLGDVVVIQDGAATITANITSDTIFASTGANVTLVNFSAAYDAESAIVVASMGNETLDGGAAAGGFSFFADTMAGDDVTYSVTSGSGGAFFATGVGTEDFTCGTGGASFEINNVGGSGALVTINDFGAGDGVNFYGLSVQQETTLLATASVVTDGNLTVTLPDGSNVEFVGVTSLSGHLF